jgi:hypothetical protein
MTRSEPFTFVDLHNEENSKKSYCRLCEDYAGKLQKLVPRLIDGVVDDRFKVCCYCGEVYPIYDIKLVSEYEPKATTVENPFQSGTQVSTVSKKRGGKRKQKGRDIANDQDVPPLAGKPDRELESMLKDRSGIINYINDDDME